MLGVILGGISGYFGGSVDLAIQRFIEFLMSLPTIPVWMGLSAARISGAREASIIAAHLVPAFMSYLIVRLTLAIPRIILGETALSFLGLGIRPPAVSWGTLLKDAQNVETVVLYPWLMLPALFVVAAVLMFNFLGDGLRDAADPYG